MMKCLTSNLEVNYPCSSVCPLFGDCVAAFQKEQKQRVHTNADSIRAMSDKELEDGIRAISLGYDPWCDHHCKMQGDDNCNVCLTNWLQKPAEDADGK